MERKSSKLETLLFEQTAILKAEYLEKMKAWARGEFMRFVKLSESAFPKYDDFKTPGFVPSDKPFGNIDYEQGKNYRKATDARHAAKRIVENGEAAYIDRAEKTAIAHYEDSIIRLAARIEKKGLNQDLLKIETARVGVNIETVLTDGVKTVKAWTIIASGAVQRPHYRYLVN